MAKGLIILTDYAFDVWHGTDTVGWAPRPAIARRQTQANTAEPYQPTRVWPLRQLFKELSARLPASKVLVDIGCGKGRVLIIASEFEFDRARGVEISSELCQIAKRNIRRYMKRTRAKTDLEIIECNAADYVIRDYENVFFLFNPFDRLTLKTVISNISRSLISAPRDIFVILNNSRYPEVLDDSGFLSLSGTQVFGGHKFTVYFGAIKSTAANGKDESVTT